MPFARERGLPTVISVHGGDLLGPLLQGDEARATVASVLGGASEVLCNSRSTLSRVAELMRDDERLRVVHLGAEAPAEPPPKRARTTVATLGHVVPRKRHVDVGLRVADYPTIQDYVGEALMDTNAARLFVYSVAQAMDRATNDNTRVLAVGELARADFLHWAWQIKFEAAKNVAHVVDKMLHCCGGTGYKKQPLQLERYLRDGKAGWVMGPTNEVLRQFVGKTALLGMQSLDYWNQVINQRAVDNELKKFTPEQKKELAERLLAEAGGNGAG